MARGRETVNPAFLEYWQSPAAFEALLSDMLFANTSPEDVIICQAFPLPADLCRTAERRGIEIAEDLQRYLAWQNGKWIDTDEMR